MGIRVDAIFVDLAGFCMENGPQEWTTKLRRSLWGQTETTHFSLKVRARKWGTRSFLASYKTFCRLLSSD
jgi:hypothetical protein